METSLYRKRCEDFRVGDLELVVTKSEYGAFIKFFRDQLPQRVNDLSVAPSRLGTWLTCVFKISKWDGHLLWMLPSQTGISPTPNRIPFALMHEEGTVPPEVKKMEVYGAPSEKTTAAQVEGKWDNAKDWGAEKIEVRREYINLLAEVYSAKIRADDALAAVKRFGRFFGCEEE